jgi:hypothetical protein
MASAAALGRHPGASAIIVPLRPVTADHLEERIMWKRLGIALRVVTLWALAATSGAAEQPLTMVDPLLGLSFDPAQVHFDVLDKTPETTRLLGTHDKWIFAAARDERGAAILIIAGFHEGTSTSEHKIERDFGTVLKMDASGLHVIGGSDYLFTKHSPVSAKTVDGLMRDASVRYVRAFGSAADLSRVLAAQGITQVLVPAPLLPHLDEQGVKLRGTKPKH